MPQIPYTGAPQVAPNYQPTSTIHPNVNPNAFGAATAEATSRMGATLGQAGNELFTRALALQQLDQQADAIHATAAVTDQVASAKLDYMTKSGKSAYDGYTPFQSQIDKLIEEGGKNLTSDFAREHYENETRQMRRYVLDHAAGHAASEFKHYQIGTEQAGADSDINQVSMDPSNEELYRTKLASLGGRADSMQAIQGESKVWRDDMHSTLTSKMVQARAKALSEDGKLKEAQEFLDQARKEGIVSGEVGGSVHEFIKSKRNQIVPRVEVPKALAGEGMLFGEGKSSNAAYAIGMIEGSGSYNPPHKYVTKGTYAGQKGVGKYGVMQGNLQPWLKEANMPKMSEREFINDHDAQDRLFAFKWNQIRSEVNSDNEAAVVWFSGKGGLEKYRNDPEAFNKVNDGASSGPRYLREFNRRLGERAGLDERQQVAKLIAQKHAPDDPEFQDVVSDKMESDWGHQNRVVKEAEFNDRHTVEAALGPAPDGKLPSSIEEIQDPAVHAAWDRLPEYLRTRYDKVLAANAKNDYAPTAENQQEFRAWMGRLTDGMASEDDRKAALDADFISMKMPAAQRQQLINAQAKMFKQGYKNPKLEHAMSVLQTQLFNAGVTRKGDEEGYFQFRGTLHDILQQRLEDGKYPDDKEIKEIGAGLLRESITSPGWIWDSTGPAFKVSVPEGESTKIKQLFLDSKGREPTEQEIQQAYAVSQFNQFYAKKAKTNEQR